MPRELFDQVAVEATHTKGVIRLDSASFAPPERVLTGHTGFDHVMGGGPPDEFSILFAGKAGIGKSSLSLPLCALFPGRKLYVGAEESPNALAERAYAFGLHEKLSEIPVAHTHEFSEIQRIIRAENPRLVIMDSLNYIEDEDSDSGDVDAENVRFAKWFHDDAHKNRRVTMLISHLNKEGQIAGREKLIHVVDAVLHIEAPLDFGPEEYRRIQCSKNRKASTRLQAHYVMTEKGLQEIEDPTPEEEERPAKRRRRA